MKYEWNIPVDGTVTVNTLCVVGLCTCIMIKMAVEKIFDDIGLEEYDVAPATESNPVGDRMQNPNVIVAEGIRLDELQAKLPETLFIHVEDLANTELLKTEIVNVFTNAGWLRISEE